MELPKEAQTNVHERGLAAGSAATASPFAPRSRSMNGTRFVHDELERHSSKVEIRDAQRVKWLAPLACKTDRIDAWVLVLGSQNRLQKG